MRHLGTVSAWFALFVLCWLPPDARAEQEAAPESVHVFYYSWYRNPATDGA